MKACISLLGAGIFWGFVAAKLVSTGYIATWSWWWLFVPYVPWIGTAIHHFGI